MAINLSRAEGSDCRRAKGSYICNAVNTKCVNCQSYNAKTACFGFHSGTKTCEQSTGGGKNVSLCHQLESNNPEQVGPSHGAGLPHSFQGGASSSARTSTMSVFRGTNEAFARRGNLLAGEGGSGDSGACCLGRRVLLDPLPGAQDGRSDEAGHKSKSIELLGSSPALQDGRYPYVSGYSSARRMACQTGSEGRLYFTVPIHRDHWKFLRFVVDQVHYQFTCLPFGLSCAPWAFTKVLKPVAAFLRSIGVCLIVYIDDILVIGKTPDKVRNHTDALIALLEGLGFIVNMEKSVLTPSQQIEFLGLLLNTTSMCLTLPGHKIRTIRKEAALLLRQGNFSARKLAQFIGKLNAASQAVFPAPLFYRHLQRDLKGALARGSQNYDSSLQLSRASREEVQWWQEHLTLWNGRALLSHRKQLVIQSDASMTGWGAVREGLRTGGPWSQAERMLHINCLEFTAATLAVQAFAKDRSGVSILLQLDNQTAVAYINHLGGTVSLQLVQLAKTLWLWALQRDIILSAQHIPGVTNQVADKESRTTTDRLDWKLSLEVFQRINAIWGPLEVDLFASRLSSQLSRFFSWRPDPLAEATDAFLQDWRHLRAYANPPWCLVGRVLRQVKA